jgi:hypothetical protein
MCEPHLLGIRNERVGKLAVRQDPVAILRNPAPGTEMNFIDAHRRLTVCRRTRARVSGRRGRPWTMEAVRGGRSAAKA